MEQAGVGWGRSTVCVVKWGAERVESRKDQVDLDSRVLNTFPFL